MDSRASRHPRRLAILSLLAVAASGATDSVVVAPDAAAEGRDLSLSALLDLTIEGVSKGRESYREAPMCLYVVDRDELERWGVRSFYDIFQRVPGYSYYNTDSYGSSGPIGRGQKSIWKFGASIELMNIGDFGHYQLTPHFFRNVEVVRGPAGLMWGTSALAGLVNFNLRDDVRGVELYTEVGDDARFVQDVLGGGAFQDGNPGDGYFVGWRYQQQDADVRRGALAGLGRQTDDYRQGGMNPSQSLVGKVQYEGLRFLVLSDHSRYVAPAMWMGKTWNGTQDAWLTDSLERWQGEDFGDEMEILSTRLEYELPFRKFLDRSFPLTVSVYREDYKKAWTFPGLVTDVQRREAWGVKGDASFLEDALRFNFGGDVFGRDQTMAPSYTSPWAQDSLGWHWYDNAGFVYPETRWRNAYLQGSARVHPDLVLLAGGRIDWVDSSSYGRLFTGPRLGAIWSPGTNLTFKYLYNSSSRPPQGNEESSLRARGGSIDPERLVAHELVALATLGDRLEVELSLFHQRIEDAIVIDPKSSDNNYTNVAGSENTGVEWAIKAVPTRSLLVSWNGSCNNMVVRKLLDPSGKEAAGTEAHNDIDQPLFVPTATSYLALDWDAMGWGHVSPALRTVYRVPYKTLDGRDDERSAWFVDLAVSSRRFLHGRVDVSASVLNLTDFDRGMPAYGEHLGNVAGTVPPEGRRFAARLHVLL